MSRSDEVQIVKDKKGKPAFVVVPYARWQAMTGAGSEDVFLAKRYRAARERDDSEVSWEIAKRIVAGENAVKVYREWRGLTQDALARKVDSAKAYISQIETGAKPGGRAILRKIAVALAVPVSALSED
ncbi:MAG: helix-turn-helix transcriptional regulator [Micropepsaceae bacterium]